jgi:hypothetical protein
MPRLHLLLIVFVAFSATTFCRADVTYYYAGHAFTSVEGSYTDSDSVSGWITFSSIPNGVSDMYASSYSFSDGVQTITNTSLGAFAFAVELDPDFPDHLVMLSFFGDDDGGIQIGWGGDAGYSIREPGDGESTVLGTWTAMSPSTSPVPEPSCFALLGTGVIGIYGISRRRRVA